MMQFTLQEGTLFSNSSFEEVKIWFRCYQYAIVQSYHEEIRTGRAQSGARKHRAKHGSHHSPHAAFHADKLQESLQTALWNQGKEQEEHHERRAHGRSARNRASAQRAAESGRNCAQPQEGHAAANAGEGDRFGGRERI